jgi:hypothetical protein
MKRLRVISMYYVDINSVLIIDEGDNFWIYRSKNIGIYHNMYYYLYYEDSIKNWFIQDRYIVILNKVTGNYRRHSSSWKLKLNIVRNKTQYLNLII